MQRCLTDLVMLMNSRPSFSRVSIKQWETIPNFHCKMLIRGLRTYWGTWRNHKPWYILDQLPQKKLEWSQRTFTAVLMCTFLIHRTEAPLEKHIALNSLFIIRIKLNSQWILKIVTWSNVLGSPLKHLATGNSDINHIKFN